MELDDLSVRLRQRTQYESLDLGVAMLRDDGVPIALGWLFGAIPLVVAIGALGVAYEGFWIWMLLIAWLKPLYARIPLFVLSRAVFGERPSAGRTVQHFFSTLVSWRGLYDWTVGRINAHRGFLLPVAELERQSVSETRDRRSTLVDGRYRFTSFLLLGVCLAMELLLVVAGFVLVEMLLPSTLSVPFSQQVEMLLDPGRPAPDAMEATAYGVYAVVVAWTETLYIAMSFGLYLNRRVELEGWNVELTFRRLARRLSSASSALIAGVLGAMLVLAGFATPTPARAQTTSSPDEKTAASPGGSAGSGGAASSDPSTSASSDSSTRLDGPEPQQAIDEIMEDPRFPHTETRETWQFRDDVWPADWEWPWEDWDLSSDGTEGLNLPVWLAFVLEVLLWAAFAAFVLGSLWYLIRQYVESSSRRSGGEAAGTGAGARVEVSEPDLELSSDIVEQATGAWRDDRPVEALAVLYRGTIRELADVYDIDVAPDTTARECVRLVREAGGPADYVELLADAWISAVYADRPPSDETIESLLEEWRRSFERT